MYKEPMGTQCNYKENYRMAMDARSYWDTIVIASVAEWAVAEILASYGKIGKLYYTTRG